jgi:6-phosphogluconolactonase
MIDVARHSYPDRDTAMRSLAELVADQLRAAHATKHRATLAVPGGATPRPFLEALSEADLAWSHVDVLLTDERLVAPTSARSNARMLHEALLKGPAAEAHLVDYLAGAGREGAPEAVRDRVAAVLPIDVLVVGMGADMHTASLFPGSRALGAALAEDAPALIAVDAPGQPEPRLTLSARVLRDASVIHILITGADKAAALATALQDGPASEAPIRAVLTAACPVSVHYAD